MKPAKIGQTTDSNIEIRTQCNLAFKVLKKKSTSQTATKERTSTHLSHSMKRRISKEDTAASIQTALPTTQRTLTPPILHNNTHSNNSHPNSSNTRVKASNYKPRLSLLVALFFILDWNYCHNNNNHMMFLLKQVGRSLGTTSAKRNNSIKIHTPSLFPMVSAFHLQLHPITKHTSTRTLHPSLKSSSSSPLQYKRPFQFTSTRCSNSNSSNRSNSNSSTNEPTSTNITKQQSKPTTTTSYIEPSLSGYKPPSVNWYPGHIAKAERTLSETLTSADVLIEIRDARIPKATSHPRVREWTVGKPRIVVLTRVDTVPKLSVRSWSGALNLFGAGKWDQYIQDGNLRHRARQNMMTRGITVNNDKRRKNNQQQNQNDDLGLVEDVIYVDAKRGGGTPALLRAIGRAGGYVNEKRLKRGLRERPLRVAVLGYPNVGKSALINRILGRKRAKSANTPGITRSLQWIRVRGDLDGTDASGRARMTKSKVNKGMRAGDFELLDSPGIIPANMDNQEDAILLAICNSVGDNAYDNQGVAAYLCERLKTLYLMGDETIRLTAPVWREKSIERYGFDPLEPMKVPTLDIESEERTRIPTGEDMLFQVAENTCRGDPENAARKILQDFRNGRMGPICLQLAPKLEENGTKEDEGSGGESFVPVRREISVLGELVNLEGGQRVLDDSEEGRRQRAENAMQAAKERGLELPPMIEEQIDDGDDMKAHKKKEDDTEVGKGLFDGW